MNVKIRCAALIVIQVFLAYNRSITLGAEDQGESQMEKGTVMLSIFFGDMLEAIYNPVLGGITPRELSKGVKTLIAMYKVPEKIFNDSVCGDNCAKWNLRIGEMQDITINLRHLMDFGDGTFEVKILNTGQVVHDMDTLLSIAGMIVR